MALVNNPLERVLDSYYYTRDALTITQRIIDQSLTILRRHLFFFAHNTSSRAETQQQTNCYDAMSCGKTTSYWLFGRNSSVGWHNLSRRAFLI